MIATLKRLVGNISVQEKNGVISIEGIPTQVMARDIQKLWRTSKIHSHMFHRKGRSYISFYSFYALEVRFILESILQESKTLLSRKSIRHILTLLHEFTWLAETQEDPQSKLDLSKLNLFHKKPLPHQDRFLTNYDRFTQQYQLNGYYLASDPGTGKTLMNLYLKEALHADVHIVICPKNAIERVWIKSLKEEYKRPRLNYWTSLQTSAPPDDAEFYICHFESIERLFALVDILNKSRKKIFLTLDESHYLNDLKSIRTQRFVNLVSDLNIKDHTWSSGTPIKAMGSEMIPFLACAADNFNSRVEDSFKKIFGLSSSRAVSILQHRLGISMTRVDKSEVRESKLIEENLPIRFKGADYFTMVAVGERMRAYVDQRIVYYREHKDRYEQDYKEALEIFEKTIRGQKSKDDFITYKQYVNKIRKTRDLRSILDEMKWCNHYEKTTIIPTLPGEMKKRFRDAKSVVKYVHLKIRGEVLGKILGRARIECSVELTKYIPFTSMLKEAQKSTLIFTNYVDVLKSAEAVTKRAGFKPQVVYGDTNKNINSILERASKDHSLNPIIATYDSLSTAIPLTFVSNIIFIDHPFRQYIRDQAVARADRLGNDDTVYLYNVLLDTGDEVNVSSRSLDIQTFYKQQVDMMLGIDPSVSLEQLALIDSTDFFKTTIQLPASLRW